MQEPTEFTERFKDGLVERLAERFLADMQAEAKKQERCRELFERGRKIVKGEPQ